MSMRMPVLVSVLLVLVMAAAGYWTWMQLPPHALVVTHWGIRGQPNGFMPKNYALFLMPAMGLFVTTLFALIPVIEPRRANLIASRKFYRTGWLGALFVMFVSQAAIVATALHIPFDIKTAIVVAVSLFYIVAGNYMGKSRANFFAGIRTPWTLSSDYSWEKTHRLGGRLFIGAGVASLIALAAGGEQAGILMLLIALFVTLAASVAMSYVYWKRDPEKNGAPAMTE